MARDFFGGVMAPVGPPVDRPEPAFAVAIGVRMIDRALLAYGRAFEHPSKIRLVRWLVRRLAGGRVRTTYAAGAMVAVDPHDYIGWAIFKAGAYEPQSLALALRIMAAEPGLFVDVGAHFGWYSCAVAALAGSHVIAIEPDAENCAALRANVALNQFGNVAVCNVAVGPEPVLVMLSKGSAGNSGTVAVAAQPVPGKGQNWAASVTLESLLSEVVRPAMRPVLLKIDVEGYEPAALAGLDFAGRFRPKHMLIECDDAFCARSWGSRERFAAFFAERGYDLFDVAGRPFASDAVLPEANVWACDRGARVS